MPLDDIAADQGRVARLQFPGTPPFAFTGETSSIWCTAGLKPAAFTWSTHFPQQPQVGLR